MLRKGIKFSKKGCIFRKVILNVDPIVNDLIALKNSNRYHFNYARYSFTYSPVHDCIFHYITLYYTTKLLNCITLYYTALHCIKLYYTISHYIAQCTTKQRKSTYMR